MQKEEPFFLKNIYNAEMVAQIAAELRTDYPAFDTGAFTAFVFDAEWPALELKQRVRKISMGMRQCLPQDIPEAIGCVACTAARMVARDGERMAFEWMVFPDFVEAFGTAHIDVALPAIKTITQLASAEFAVRPFLVQHFDRTLAQMYTWSEHPSAMVRRLSTEGIRPRLPWGMGVPVLKRDPMPILPILERLKGDPAETVRRSVANNLNDISKDHVALALSLAKNWLGHSENTDWVVRHACRGLLKKGNATALALFGFEQGVANMTVDQLECPAEVAIGDTLHFSFRVTNQNGASVNARVEYAIDYLTSTGAVSRKVFQVREQGMEPGVETLLRKQRFTDFTTRKHYPGGHRLDILVNGSVLASAEFRVVLAG
jgi:3-methyladenine DNA glycosylase AlkC